MKNLNKLKILIYFIVIILVIILINVFHIDLFSKINNLNESFSEHNLNKIDVSFVSCVDGNTFVLKENESIYTYKLLGVDTMNIGKYSNIAKTFVCRKLINAKKISIEYEKTSLNIDENNNHLVWIYIDDKLLQTELLESGLAKISNIYTNLTYFQKIYKSRDSAIKNRSNYYSDYSNRKENSNTYTIIFKLDNGHKEINVKEGDVINPIANPQKKGYTFVGWKNDKLYDFSNPIESNLILTAVYTKNT